jgi:hypothetical protein
MAGRLKSAGTVWMAATALLLLPPAAHAQSGRKGHAAASTETKPKVDEKAYKAALDRIPTPKKPYDPWGQVHEDSSAKPGGKSN